jgi:hypothetical protein
VFKNALPQCRWKRRRILFLVVWLVLAAAIYFVTDEFFFSFSSPEN